MGGNRIIMAGLQYIYLGSKRILGHVSIPASNAVLVSHFQENPPDELLDVPHLVQSFNLHGLQRFSAQINELLDKLSTIRPPPEYFHIMYTFASAS